jgi:hypothetical protein
MKMFGRDVGTQPAAPEEVLMTFCYPKILIRSSSAIAILIVGVCGASAQAKKPTSHKSHANDAPPVPCIAIANPVLQGTPGNTADVSTGVRDLIVGYLTTPSVVAVPLDTKLPSQAAEEAKQKGCQALLITNMVKKSGGGNRAIWGAVGQAANAASVRIPSGVSAASVTASSVATAGLQSVATLAQNTKARDEIRLDYRLQSPDGRVLLGPKTEHLTAKTDGEDLLTPLVVSAAEAVVSSYATVAVAPPATVAGGAEKTASSAVEYLDHLKACTAFTFKYPHPLHPGFTAKTVIRGQKGDKCEVIYLAPDDQLVECEFSARTITLMTSTAKYKEARAGAFTGSLSEAESRIASRECH